MLASCSALVAGGFVFVFFVSSCVFINFKIRDFDSRKDWLRADRFCSSAILIALRFEMRSFSTLAISSASSISIRAFLAAYEALEREPMLAGALSCKRCTLIMFKVFTSRRVIATSLLDRVTTILIFFQIRFYRPMLTMPVV